MRSPETGHMLSKSCDSRGPLFFMVSQDRRNDEASLELSSSRLDPVSRGMKRASSVFAVNKEIKHPPPVLWV